jgi:hypothetical protein
MDTAPVELQAKFLRMQMLGIDELRAIGKKWLRMRIIGVPKIYLDEL